MSLYTPPKINIVPENAGLEGDFFLFQGARILRFHVTMLIFRGVAVQLSN